LYFSDNDEPIKDPAVQAGRIPAQKTIEKKRGFLAFFWLNLKK